MASYEYDDANRLTSIAYTLAGNPLGDLTYTYDASGNRTSVGGSWARTSLPHAVSNATYDAANRLATWAATSFRYDSNGNLISNGLTSYTWNARNQLVELAGASSASFAYDGSARRRAKTVAGTTMNFLYDGLNTVQELSGGGLPTANLLTGLGIDETLTRTDATGTTASLIDGLGSTTELADGSGTLQVHYVYEAFGKTTESGANSANSGQFTGRDNDGTGLYYFRARYYDPEIGRFLSEDPEGFIDGPNVYAYVRNNPVRYVDPWGLAGCECPPKKKNCLEELFNQPIGNVEIVTKPPSKRWNATTRKNKIIVSGSCEDFFDDPDTVLEEYYHVLEQWNKGRLSRVKYGLAYLFHGYDNKYEREAKTWVQQNVQTYLDCLSRQD